MGKGKTGAKTTDLFSDINSERMGVTGLTLKRGTTDPHSH